MVDTVNVFGVPHAYELTPPVSSAPTLVFIHGWLLSRAYWRPIIERLASEYQCLAYDLRGFGSSQPLPKSQRPGRRLELTESFVSEGRAGEVSVEATAAAPHLGGKNQAIAAPTPGGYAPADYARDLVGLLEHLNITNAWLVGHSLGGSIALWAADQMPRCIQGVICVNFGGGIYLKEEFERFRSVGRQLVKMRPRWLCHLPLMDMMMTWMNVAQPLDRAWGRQRLLDLVMADPQAALGTLLDSTTETEVHRLPQVVSRLKQPVHFIAGADDTVMDPQYVLHLASFHHSFQCCGHNVTQIPNCGHLAMVEHPDIVAEQIRIVTMAQVS